MFKTVLQERWTTVTGIGAAVAIYLSSVGPQAPQTRADWGHFIAGLLVAALGVVAKDAPRPAA